MATKYLVGFASFRVRAKAFTATLFGNSMVGEGPRANSTTAVLTPLITAGLVPNSTRNSLG